MLFDACIFLLCNSFIGVLCHVCISVLCHLHMCHVFAMYTFVLCSCAYSCFVLCMCVVSCRPLCVVSYRNRRVWTLYGMTLNLLLCPLGQISFTPRIPETFVKGLADAHVADKRQTDKIDNCLTAF